eukprot:jgi/Botrbrau1/16143/Bobra.0349s0005.1
MQTGKPTVCENLVGMILCYNCTGTARARSFRSTLLFGDPHFRVATKFMLQSISLLRGTTFSKIFSESSPDDSSDTVSRIRST